MTYLLFFYINIFQIKNISRVFGNTIFLNKTTYPLHLREDSIMTLFCSVNYLECTVKQTRFLKAPGNLMNEIINRKNNNNTQLE